MAKGIYHQKRNNSLDKHLLIKHKSMFYVVVCLCSKFSDKNINFVCS